MQSGEVGCWRALDAHECGGLSGLSLPPCSIRDQWDGVLPSQSMLMRHCPAIRAGCSTLPGMSPYANHCAAFGRLSPQGATAHPPSLGGCRKASGMACSQLRRVLECMPIQQGTFLHTRRATELYLQPATRLSQLPEGSHQEVGSRRCYCRCLRRLLNSVHIQDPQRGQRLQTTGQRMLFKRIRRQERSGPAELRGTASR